MARFIKTCAVGLIGALFGAVVVSVAHDWETLGVSLLLVILLAPTLILYAWSDAKNCGWHIRVAAFCLPLMPWVAWCMYLMFFAEPNGDPIQEIGAFVLSCLSGSAACSALSLYALAIRNGSQKSPVVYPENASPNLASRSSENPYQSPQGEAVPLIQKQPTIASAIGFLLAPIAALFLLPAIPKPPTVGILFTGLFITTGSWWLATRRGWASTVIGAIALLLSLAIFSFAMGKGYWRG